MRNALFASAIVLSSTLVLAEETPRPRLVVDEDVLELGVVSQGEEIAGAFILRNEGDAVLSVLKAKPS